MSQVPFVHEVGTFKGQELPCSVQVSVLYMRVDGVGERCNVGDGDVCVPTTPVTLRDLRVFVDEAAEAIPPDDTRWAID
ncbi:hypothetical protein ACWCQN_46525, partial [Streptomyces sp. NPDC001984]